MFQKAINGLRDEVWWNGEMEKVGINPEGEWQKMNDLLLQNIEADNPHGGAIQIFENRWIMLYCLHLYHHHVLQTLETRI